MNLTPGTKWVESTGFMDADKGTIKAGHAGGILVDKATGSTKYYDYGRYGKDSNKGIVRSSKNTPALSLPNAVIDNEGSICNLNEILISLAGKKLFEGYGKMTASISKGVTFADAEKFAKDLQDKGETPYGPFQYGGSNCSRFIQDLICAGDAPYSVQSDVKSNITPSPQGNVENADTEEKIYTVEGGKVSTNETGMKNWFKSKKKE